MTKKNSKKLFGGLTAVLATLLSISIGMTTLAYQWEPLVNAALGITMGNSIFGGDESVDTNYYKSSFGDISALYKNDPTAEESAALDKAQTDLLEAEKAFAIREQEEGSVLLKNGDVDGQPALPLLENERSVTLFGNSAGQPVYRTSAAGADPGANPRLITYADAFRNSGFTINETLQTALENSEVARVRDIDTKASIGEVPVSFYDAYKDSFNSNNDVAIVMFSRMAGEGLDYSTKDSEGISQLALHEDEADLLKMIKDSGMFKKTVVLLNSAAPLETEFLFDEQYGVDACLWIGEPSLYGFQGVVNLLKGDANPSGRLVDTYAANSMSSPAVLNFGNISYSNNSTYKYIVEAEGIYVGYKYYETRYEDVILNQGNASSVKGSSSGSAWNYADEVTFPFGYGLSYTQFTQTLDSVEYNEQTDSYIVTVTVKNTGTVAGKSVVQVYAQTPYSPESNIEKSAIQLVGYNKTLGTVQTTGEKETVELTSREGGMLAPGEEEVVQIEVEKYLLASYSTSARQGMGGYVLTAGDYYLAIGENAHDALNNVLAAKKAEGMTDENGNAVAGDMSKVKLLEGIGDEYDETTYSKSRTTDATVENQLGTADANHWQNGAVTYLSRSDWDATFPTQVSLELSDEMKKEMDGGVYAADSSAVPKNTYKQGEDSGISFIDMRGVPFTGTYTDDNGVEHNADEEWEEFLNQLTVEEMVVATTSNASNGVSKINAPKVNLADGPDGFTFSLNNGEVATSYPSEIIAAATFNPKTLRMRGDFLAEDAIFTGCQVLYGPGANLHRTPFSGRNFEYYSEDANMNYLCGYYEISAMNDKGLIATVKHYVGNNQETNRDGVATFNNEQAWREGSLRGFEGAISKAHSNAVMTSYSLIGCTPSVSYYATNVQILQNEWGFTGINITDGAAGKAYMNSVDAVMNGTGMFCLDNRESDLKKAASRSEYDDIVGALRQLNKKYYYTTVNSIAANGITPGASIVSSTPWWKGAMVAIELVVGVLMVLCACAYVYCSYVKKDKEEANYE